MPDKTMKIGSIALSSPTVFAPLAGITNLPMRLLAKEAGCGLVCSEMVSAVALVRGTGKTREMLDSAPRERPLSMQLFGADPAILAKAGRMVQTAGADILDINFGCSVKKILKSGSGSALMRDLPRARVLLEAVRTAVDIPVTIKIRAGWDASGSQALELSHIAQNCGVNAITVHPRTARQGFSGKADWDLIARIKCQSNIPVIGNGDINNADDAQRMFKETGCDAVMIGRGAIGNPFIFHQIDELLAGRPLPAVAAVQRFDIMRRYLRASVQYLGEKRACPMMRSRLGWFSKGLPQASRFRHAIRQVSSESEALKLIDAFEQQWMSDINNTD